MKTIQFKDVALNSEFVFQSKTYIKIEPQKISCCRSLNAQLKNTPAVKTMIRPDANVEIADDEQE